MKRSVLVVVVVGFILSLVPLAPAADRGEFDQALKYYNRGKFGEAVSHLRRYVEERPDPAGYYLLGYSLYKMKKFDEAAEHFSQAYLIDPSFAPERSGLPQPPAQPKAKGKKKTPQQRAAAAAAGKGDH